VLKTMGCSCVGEYTLLVTLDEGSWLMGTILFACKDRHVVCHPFAHRGRSGSLTGEMREQRSGWNKQITERVTVKRRL